MTKTIADLKAEKKAIMKALNDGDKAMRKIDKAANKLWNKYYALEDKINIAGTKAKKSSPKSGKPGGSEPAGSLFCAGKGRW